jgi:hypothetical protein
VPQRPLSPFRQRPAYQFVKATLPTVRSAATGAFGTSRASGAMHRSTEKDRRVS